MTDDVRRRGLCALRDDAQLASALVRVKEVYHDLAELVLTLGDLLVCVMGLGWDFHLVLGGPATEVAFLPIKEVGVEGEPCESIRDREV